MTSPELENLARIGKLKPEPPSASEQEEQGPSHAQWARHRHGTNQAALAPDWTMFQSPASAP
jgi:hypothetical protein